jgi:hypothetical protein
MRRINRRQFLRELGLSAAAAPFVMGLPSVSGAKLDPAPKRLIIMFSPNGTIPEAFWPDKAGAIEALKPILSPLDALRSRVTVLNGVCNQVRGDGDNHMRGMSCLLTGHELFPGNIQGGSHTPAGWAKGISIDQEIRNFLQSRDDTRTRFGSLEFGVAVPNRADPWTRMSYAGPNKPVAPIDDPRQMLDKLYGSARDTADVLSIVDGVKDDLRRVSDKLSPEDRRMLAEHMELVAAMESDLKNVDGDAALNHPVPQIDPTIELVNDNTPQISRMQIDLLVNSFANNMARVATLQFMRSVGQARMNWLGVEAGHHSLSHEPDNNHDAHQNLIRINTWFCGELAYLAQRLAETPEPGGDSGGGGNMLDNTLIVWTNELGKGNSHTLNNIPMVLVGGENLGIKSGRCLQLDKIPHNRLLIALARAMGHDLPTFGLPNLCEAGPVDLT